MKMAKAEYPNFDFVAPSFNAPNRLCHFCKQGIETVELTHIKHANHFFCSSECLDEWQIEQKWWLFGRRLSLDHIRRDYFFSMI